MPRDISVVYDNYALLLKPAWRILIASLVVELASEMIDTEMYHLWVNYVTRRHQWCRVLVSNLLSVPVGSLFTFLVLSEVFPPKIVWPMLRDDVVVKIIATLRGMPLIYLGHDTTKEQ